MMKTTDQATDRIGTEQVNDGKENVSQKVNDSKPSDIIPLAKERGWNLLKLGGGLDRKTPIEKWQNFLNEARSPDELAGHEDNFGIITGEGSGNLLVVDFDSREAAEKCINLSSAIAHTFVVKTKRGFHIYHRTSEKMKSYAINIFNPRELTKIGRFKPVETVNFQSEGKYVVAPFSLHYNKETGKKDGKYEPLSDLPPRKITVEELEGIKRGIYNYIREAGYTDKDFVPSAKKISGGDGSVIEGLPRIENAIDTSNFQHRGDELISSHPFHGSTTGHNFSINTEKQSWFCFRCSAGGYVLSLLAMKYKIADCSEFVGGKNPLKGDRFQRLVERVKEEYGIEILKKSKLVRSGEEWLEYKENKQGETIGVTVKYGILAEHLVNKEHIITFRDNGESYIYEKGVYIYGQPIIREKIQELVPVEYLKKMHKNETEDAIIGMTGVNRLEVSRETPKNLINLKNGLLNLETMEILPHTPTFFSFSQVATAWKKDAACPIFEEFLLEVLPREEDRKTLQEFFGSILLNDMRYQKALVLLGDGGNGKSTVLNIIKEVIGAENVATETIQNLISNRFRLANIYGEMANLCPDNPSSKVADSGIFKAITGGDTVTGEKKGRDSFKFESYATMILSANSLPKTEDASDAYFERFIIIYFNRKFRGVEGEVKNIAHKIASAEAEGILNWMIEGLKRLLKNDKFTINPTTEEIKEEYIRKSDPISAFYLDMIIEDDEAYTTKQEMYSAYKKYCKAYKMHVSTDSVFAREFHTQSEKVFAKRMLMGEGKKKKQVYVWVGVLLSEQPLLGYEIRPQQGKGNESSISGGKQLCIDMLAGVAGVNGKPHVTREKRENIIGKCYILKNMQEVYVKLQQRGKIPQQPQQGGNFHAKTSQPDLFFERDRNEATEQNIKTLKKLLADLNITPGDHGRHDKADLLKICNKAGLTTAEAIEAIEDIGGIEAEPLGTNTVYDFSDSAGEASS